MTAETTHSLVTNLGCLLLTLAVMYLIERLAPKFSKWLVNYLVYRHYPKEYQRLCICGESFLMHEGDGGPCNTARPRCRKFMAMTLLKKETDYAEGLR